jgi:hypothetical protein
MSHVSSAFPSISTVFGLTLIISVLKIFHVELPRVILAALSGIETSLLQRSSVMV